jgi:hypothetical protein
VANSRRSRDRDFYWTVELASETGRNPVVSIHYTLSMVSVEGHDFFTLTETAELATATDCNPVVSISNTLSLVRVRGHELLFL